MTQQLFANTSTLSVSWQSIASELQKPIEVINSKQEKIVYSAQNILLLSKPEELEETSIIELEITDSNNAKTSITITSDDPPFSTKGAVDMTKIPYRKGLDYNSLGFPRDAKYFWSVYSDPFNGLSPSNKITIAKGGIPTVDVQWQTNVPGESKAIIGEPIEHHHVNKGRYAIPRALSLHRTTGWYKKIHPKFITSTVFEKDGSIFGRTGKTIVGSVFGWVGLISVVVDVIPTDNPNSTQNTIYQYIDGVTQIMPSPFSGWKKGRLYYIDGMDAYIECENDSGTSWTIYDKVGYDESEKKYFGIVVLKQSPRG
jgi:hypothetical protein